MSSAVNTKAIGDRLREARGPRTLQSQAEKMGLSRQRLSQMEHGDVPEQWMYLVRLAEDGVDVDWLITGGNGAK